MELENLPNENFETPVQVRRNIYNNTTDDSVFRTNAQNNEQESNMKPRTSETKESFDLFFNTDQKENMIDEKMLEDLLGGDENENNISGLLKNSQKDHEEANKTAQESKEEELISEMVDLQISGAKVALMTSFDKLGKKIAFKRHARRLLTKAGFYLPSPRSKASTYKYFEQIFEGNIVVLPKEAKRVGILSVRASSRVIFLMITRKVKKHGFTLKNLPDRQYLIDYLYYFDPSSIVFGSHSKHTNNPKYLKKVQNFLNAGKRIDGDAKINDDILNNISLDFDKTTLEEFLNLSSRIICHKMAILSSMRALKDSVYDISHILNLNRAKLKDWFPLIIKNIEESGITE